MWFAELQGACAQLRGSRGALLFGDRLMFLAACGQAYEEFIASSLPNFLAGNSGQGMYVMKDMLLAWAPAHGVDLD